MRQHVRQLLERANYQLLEAEDGLAGLVKARQCQPDLVITDREMPHMDGTKLVMMLRQDPALSNVGIVMLTVHDDLDSRVTGLDSGVDDYLTKNCPERELIARVNAVLRLRQAIATVQRQNERLEQEWRQRERIRQDLSMQQKQQALGQLAAGIAHEINTPAQYIGDNGAFLANAFASLTSLLRDCERLLAEAGNGELLERFEKCKKATELAYLTEEVPSAASALQAGVRQISKIVRATKQFAAPDATQKGPQDVNELIEEALTLAQGKSASVAEVELDLGQLALVHCDANEVKEVLLCLLLNSMDAIQAKGDNEKGLIQVSSQKDGTMAVVRVRDNGCGIPEQALQRVFDPFFTTKPVGQGMGMGLTVAKAIVEEKHAGQIRIVNRHEPGATIEVRLPFARAPG